MRRIFPSSFEHLTLDLKVDPKAKTLEGVATYKRVKTIAADQGWLKLDQIGLTFDEVKVAGKKAQFETEGQALKIQLPQNGGRGPSIGESSGECPVPGCMIRGAVFIHGAHADYPKKLYQVWSQGQDVGQPRHRFSVLRLSQSEGDLRSHRDRA